MELFAYDADDVAAVHAAVTIRREVALADSPWERPSTTYRHALRLRHGDDGEPGRWFLVREEGRDIGLVATDASGHDNVDLVWLGIAIRPADRGAGRGGRALRLALEECRRAGRPSVLFYGWEAPALRRLAAGAGLTERSVEIRRRLDLDGTAAETERFGLLRAQAAEHARSYELVRVPAPSPPELLAELGRVTEAINDAPLDDVEMEDQRFDADRVRAYESAQTACGFRLRRVVARHRATGALAGHTVVAVDCEQPAWGEQHDTAVLPEHRGHRLGLLLKLEMLRWLAEEEPQLRHVLTENMESNGPMVSVNELLGYRVVGRQLLFQRRL